MNKNNLALAADIETPEASAIMSYHNVITRPAEMYM